jgi:uncharacterized SAM-binding protein YcdF (DUF218 family)
MFPYVTRIFWLLFQPMSVIALLLVIGLVLSFSRRQRLGRWLVLLAVLLLLVTGFTNSGNLLIEPLEGRFIRPPEPARIDGIVVLGGGLSSEVSTARGGYELNASGDRYVEALRLALSHPEAKIVIAAGNAVLQPEAEPEAVTAQRFLAAFGIAPGRVVIDPNSRNTEENAQFARALAGPAEGQTWLLVTSGFHMPRSVGLFRAAGFAVVPWPVDYLTTGAEGLRVTGDASANLSAASLALREWAGLLGYRLTGKIADWFPGP